MNHTYLRGDMYYADLGRGVGSEQEGYRPVVIIQNNVGNKHSPTVIIASITSKTGVKAKLPTHYYIDAEDGLELPSIVLLEQLRTVDKRRLGNFIGHIIITKSQRLSMIVQLRQRRETCIFLTEMDSIIGSSVHKKCLILLL